MSQMNIHRLRSLHWRVDQLMNEALSQMDLTASQGCIMGYVNHCQSPPCPRDVEEQFDLSHACVSGILSRLEKKGFIALRPDEQDRRCKRIYVLEKGLLSHSLMHETIMSIEARMTAGFTAEESDTLVRLLDRVNQNMGGGESGCPDKERKRI